MHADLIEEMQAADSRDHITEAHSALDPLQELACDNECSVAELIEYLNNHQAAPAPMPEEIDPNIPF